MRLLSSLMLMVLLLVGCSSSSAPPPTKPLVVVSIAPQAFLVNRLAGESLEVAVLIPSGANHETYEPTIAELQELARAKLFIKVGHPNFAFETTWLPQLLRDHPALPVVDTSKNLALLSDDPHTWVAPANMRIMAKTIHDALVGLLPLQRSILDDRLKILLSEIEALDAKTRQTLASKKRSKFLVMHPAWGYWAQAYGLEQMSIEQDGKEPDPRGLSLLLDQARAEHIRTLFVEPRRDNHTAQSIARELRADLVTLDPMARDWLENQRHVAMAVSKALRE